MIVFIFFLVPTRELSVQVNKEINRIAPKLKAISVYGGQPVNAQGKNYQMKCLYNTIIILLL